MIAANRRSFLLRTGCAASALACATPVAATATATAPVASPPALADLIARERRVILAAMAARNVEGAAVCFIAEGAPVWIEGFGVTDRASGRAVADDTIFSIQSTSKNMTATAVMLAVQRGLLDLDEPIGAYLPRFSVHSRFEPAPQTRITLRLLLSHRAGFTHEAPVGNNYDAAFPSFEAHVRSISDTWLRFPVGERYRYSNLGFDLAGYILQVRCGAPFAECMRTMLFGPLGMGDSTVAGEVYERRENRAVGHDEGHVTVPLRTPLIPSGGVYTSARDMAAYARFHLGQGKVGGRIVLSETLWREMHGFGLGGDYSLGVIRTELRYGDTPLRMLSHKGGGFGFGSVFDYCPPAGLAWAALFNRPVSAAYRFGEGLVNDTLARRYGAPKPRLAASDLPAIDLNPAQRETFVGGYVGRNVEATITSRDGALWLQQGGTPSELRFRSPTEAFVAAPDGDAVTYACLAGGPGEPAHLECSIGENSLDANGSPHDAPGPANPAWRRWCGRYRIYQWGVPSDDVVIGPKNGFLYLDKTRLVVETEPGLFFTADGEAVDFRGARPTWKNLRLQRVSS